jgi:hypothetical protein
MKPHHPQPVTYTGMCTRALLQGVPSELSAAGGDLGEVIDRTFGRVLGHPHRSRAMPLTHRVDQAARRLAARLGHRGEFPAC